MRSATLAAITISAGLMLSAAAADAAMISGTYSVTGSNFISLTKSPYDSITESFTVSFDNTLPVSQQTTAISLNPSTITPTSTLAFTYVPGADILTVGGIAATVATSDPASTDFAVTISNASSLSGYSVTALSYSVGNGSTYTALTRSVAATSVPEPTSLAIIGGAVAMAGYLRRRKAR